MQVILDFIKSDIGIISAYIFGAVGLISAYWTYRSYRDSRRQSQRYSVLFDAADKKIEKDIIDKELVSSKKQQEEIKQDILLMREDISSNIPTAAKKAALQNKLEEQIDLLSEQYSSVCETRKKLNEFSSNESIMSEIEEVVKGEITPSYYFNKEKQYLKDKVILISLLVLFINNLLPNLARGIVCFIGFTYIIPDIKTLLKNYEVNFIELGTKFIIRAVTTASIFCNTIVIFFLLEYNSMYITLQFLGHKEELTRAVLITARISFLVMFIMVIKIIYRIKKLKIIFVLIPTVLTGIYLFMFYEILYASRTISLSTRKFGIDGDIVLFLNMESLVACAILFPKLIIYLGSFLHKRKPKK